VRKGGNTHSYYLAELFAGNSLEEDRRLPYSKQSIFAKNREAEN